MVVELGMFLMGGVGTWERRTEVKPKILCIIYIEIRQQKKKCGIQGQILMRVTKSSVIYGWKTKKNIEFV